MRNLLYVVFSMGLAALAFVGLRFWHAYSLLPSPSIEVAQLSDQAIQGLTRLRAETKFQPNDFPPVGYAGAESEADRAKASGAVNAVIDAILVRSDQPVHATAVSKLIAKAMNDVDLLATEDRDRTAGYLLEIWYIAGFKGATGRFAYGAAFPKPAGYGEPLPPGWKSPTEPRAIGG
jgi:hypothetical protein